MSNAELNTTARDLMSVRAMIAELDEAEALTDKIKAAMVEQGTEVIQGDGWRASWKNVTSSRIKYYSAIRMDVRQYQINAQGMSIRVNVTKNKCAAPYKTAELYMDFENGGLQEKQTGRGDE